MGHESTTTRGFVRKEKRLIQVFNIYFEISEKILQFLKYSHFSQSIIAKFILRGVCNDNFKQHRIYMTKLVL